MSKGWRQVTLQMQVLAPPLPLALLLTATICQTGLTLAELAPWAHQPPQLGPLAHLTPQTPLAHLTPQLTALPHRHHLTHLTTLVLQGS